MPLAIVLSSENPLTNENGEKMVRIGEDRKMRLRELVISLLGQRGKPMSTNELANVLGRSWAFTNKLMLSMGRKGLVKKIVYGSGHFWQLR